MLNPVLERFSPKSMEPRARSWPMIPSRGGSSSVVRKPKRPSSQHLYRSSGDSPLAMHLSLCVGEGETDIPGFSGACTFIIETLRKNKKGTGQTDVSAVCFPLQDPGGIPSLALRRPGRGEPPDRRQGVFIDTGKRDKRRGRGPRGPTSRRSPPVFARPGSSAAGR